MGVRMKPESLRAAMASVAIERWGCIDCAANMADRSAHKPEGKAAFS